MKDIAYDLVIKEIKGRLSILNLAQNYVSLKKSGRGYTGLCPFHDEKTPSFHVNEERGIFHCFGCGAGGDIFGFVMRYKNVSFPEALEELAKRTGVQIEKKSRDKGASPLGALYKINSLVSAFYHKTLFERDGAQALGYLRGRGISDETIREFGLGYAPGGWDGLVKFLASKKAPLPLAERLGLVIAKSGGYYDRFRARVMFPIGDVDGRVVGFGGRVIENAETPKYMNSPESEIYHKRSTLFGLDKSRDHIRRAESALIVEGYMDFLSLWGAGVKNAVATLGTSLTRDHAMQMRRYADKAGIIFDGDKAGEAASLRALEVFLEQGVSPRTVLMPKGEDPASLIAAGRREEFLNLMNEAKPLLDFFLEKTLADLESNKITRAKAAGVISDALGKIKEPVERSHYAKKSAEILGVREEEMLSLMNRRRKPDKIENSETRKPADTAERLMLKILIKFPNLAELLPSDESFIDSLPDEEERSVIEEIVLRGFDDVSSLLLKFSDTSAQSVISEILFSSDNVPEEAEAARILKDCVRKLKIRKLEDGLKTLRIKIDRASNEKNGALEKNLIKEYRDLMERGKAIKGETL